MIHPLSQPIGSLLRPAPAVRLEGSLGVAARALRESGSSVVAVLDGAEAVGILTERELLRALEEGSQPTDAILNFVRPAPRLSPSDSGAEALRRISETGAAGALVIDDNDSLVGIVTPVDLYDLRKRPNRPKVVGGMATPFGVYLTTGAFGVGVGPIALVATGMTLMAITLASGVLSTVLAEYMAVHNARSWAIDLVGTVVATLVFALTLRAIPLSGIHAAEHKVVNAIEQDEELTIEALRRMSRVHPRCGTNLALGATIYLAIGTTSLIPDPTVRLLVAAVVPFIFWKPLGTLAQLYVTTKPPTDKQLEMGLRSGKKLLDEYQKARIQSPNFGQRIMSSGLPYVSLGSVLCYLMAKLVATLAGFPNLFE